MDILVSACLLGTPCRYDGASRPCGELARLEVLGHRLIPVCPEVMGGLPTPRPPAELQRDGPGGGAGGKGRDGGVPPRSRRGCWSWPGPIGAPWRC